MNVFQFFIVNLILLVSIVISINAQTEKSQAVNSGKIAVINFELLKDEKTGIKDFVDVDKKLEIEFKPKDDELHLLFVKVQTLLKELKELEHLGEIRITKEFVENKFNEFELAGCKILRKQQEVKSLYEKRYSDLTEELNKKIISSLKLFAKDRDYKVILDSSKNNSVIIESEIVDVTNEFIQFYNKQKKQINLWQGKAY